MLLMLLRPPALLFVAAVVTRPFRHAQAVRQAQALSRSRRGPELVAGLASGVTAAATSKPTSGVEKRASSNRATFAERSPLKLIPLLLAGLWLAAALPATAAPAPAAHFLAADDINLTALLPAPPADDSIVTRAELEVLYHLQVERTPAQVARARLVDTEEFFSFGSDVLGPWFEAKNLPRTAAFFAQVGEDLTPISRVAKGLYKRRRPPFLDARLQPCVEFSDTPSYPSGHGMRSALWASLLTTLFPDQAAGFAHRAAESRWGRLLGGVHCPSDVEAGRIVGEALARELLKQPNAQKALEELRAECSPLLLKKAG